MYIQKADLFRQVTQPGANALRPLIFVNNREIFSRPIWCGALLRIQLGRGNFAIRSDRETASASREDWTLSERAI